jgi:RNA recognition motif-containing protein
MERNRRRHESMKVFVSGLPLSATEEQLAELFVPFGAVLAVKVVRDRYTNRSRGYGFVEMAKADAAQAAIAALSGHEIEGRRLLVTEARGSRNSGRRR